MRHFPLDGQRELIVETNPIYQPDLGREAHFAGIWPLEGQGPHAKTWIVADCPADAFTLAQEWAGPALAELQGPAPETDTECFLTMDPGSILG